MTPVRCKALIVARNLSGSWSRPKRVPRFLADGIAWAVPPEIEIAMLARVGDVVEIEIRCPDDQFAYLVAS